METPNKMGGNDLEVNLSQGESGLKEVNCWKGGEGGFNKNIKERFFISDSWWEKCPLL